MMKEQERSPGNPEQAALLPKVHDAPYYYRGTWDREPVGVCGVRVFAAPGRTPVLVCSERPDNPSTSITNMAEILVAELIAHLVPHRFEELEPAIVLEHYPTAYDHRGRVARAASWDRLSFGSWSPRRIWLGGRERVGLGEPQWHPIPQAEVEQLIGQEEAQG